MELAIETRRFMERVAELLEMMGIPRSSGRMFGLLLVADRPLSLDEIADTLKLSKPSVSMNARLYERLQLLQRTHVPGDRRHYYEILPGAFERTVEARMAAIHGFIELTRTGLEVIDDDNDVARARLETMRDFYKHLEKAMREALDSWKANKGP